MSLWIPYNETLPRTAKDLARMLRFLGGARSTLLEILPTKHSVICTVVSDCLDEFERYAKRASVVDQAQICCISGAVAYDCVCVRFILICTSSIGSSPFTAAV